MAAARKARVAWLLTHRIQYFVNLIDTLHARGNVEVALFLGTEPGDIVDPGFGTTVRWDNRTNTAFPETYLGARRRPAVPGPLRSMSPSLNSALSSFDPDYVYVNGYTDAIAWQGLVWAARHSTSLGIRCDGDTLVERGLLKVAARRALARPFLAKASHVTHQGRQNELFWRQLGAHEEQLRWAPCVADSQVYRASGLGPELRAEIRLSRRAGPDDVVCLVSGKLIARKRPGDALKAIALLDDPRVKLWFLGSGELEQELRGRSEELGLEHRVEFLGFLNQTQIPAVLRAADVLLHCAQADPWPYSVLEAATCGLPLVLSDRTGSHPDWMHEPSCGAVFRYGDPADAARALRELLSDPVALRRAGDNAMRRSETYTEERFCEIFEGLVAESPSVR